MIVDKKIIQERKEEYGDSFPIIAALWENYLTNRTNFEDSGIITPQDAAIMMGLMKISRLANSPWHEDSLTDLINYFYIGLNYDEYCNMDKMQEQKSVKDFLIAKEKQIEEMQEKWDDFWNTKTTLNT